jgi:hypothetical protein
MPAGSSARSSCWTWSRSPRRKAACSAERIRVGWPPLTAVHGRH